MFTVIKYLLKGAMLGALIGIMALAITLWCETIADGADRSPEWQSVRAGYYKLHQSCEVCGGKKDLQVHHIVPFHDSPEMELDMMNLLMLCRPHHLLFGHLMNYKSHNPSVRGDAIIWREKIRSRPGGNQ
jgi:5-methylcytosine-specific restriction protein A